MGRPIRLDPWARALARRIAKQTGWRASEVYAFVTGRVGAHDRRTIVRVLDIIVECRLIGESFKDAALRILEAAAAMDDR